MLIFLVSTLMVWYQLYRSGFWEFNINLSSAPFYLIAICLLIVTATITAVLTFSRLVAIVSLGVVGFSMALIFVIYGAVDVAITLILVETLIVILFVMIVYHLPQYVSNFSKPASRLRDILIALFFGGSMAVLVLKAEFVRISPPISEYFLKNSLIEAHGRNIVNVILVDFRALDTLGESIVLIIAAIGVYSLLKLNPKKRQK
jgi:multicomponent Na+:H+ antiporter subunit A